LIQEEVTFDSIVAQDHSHSEFFSRLLVSFGIGSAPDEHSFMAFDTGVEHLARELALSNPGQP
jgi:hypothetical protein